MIGMVEVFFGEGALFYALKPKVALINDINVGVVSSLNSIKNKPEELMKLLDKRKESHSLEYYLKTRKESHLLCYFLLFFS